MPYLSVTPLQGFLLTLFILSLLPILGGVFGYFLYPKIKDQQNLFSLFSAYLMILLSLYLLAVVLLQIKIIRLSPIRILPGFIFGFLITLTLMTIHNFLSGKSHLNKSSSHQLNIGLILFLVLAIHEILEGFSVAEIFSDFGPAKFPWLVSFVSVSILAMHEFPEGLLLVLPFFLAKRIKEGVWAIFFNQMIFLTSSLVFYFFILRFFSISLFEKSFWATLPAGGIFYLGLHEFKLTLALPTKQIQISPFSRLALALISLILLFATITSLYLTNEHLEEKTKVQISGYELDEQSGKLRPVIYAEPCEHNFKLEGCLDD